MAQVPRLIQLLSAMALFVAATPAQSQIEASAEFNAAYEAGDFATALSLIQPEAATCVEEAGGDAATATTLQPCFYLLTFLALTLIETGPMEQAVEIARLAQSVGAEADPNGESHALGNMTLGVVLERTGRHAEADPIMRAALAMSEQRLGPDNPELASILLKRGTNLFFLARFDEALQLIERAIALAPDPTDRALFRLIHGRTLQSLGRLAEAEATLRAGAEALTGLVGETHPMTLGVLESLALCLDEQNRPEEAIVILRKTLAAKRAQTGSQILLSDSLTVLGSAMLRTGDFREAEALFREALALRTKYFGETSTFTGLAYSNLALALIQQENIEEAAFLIKQALEIMAKSGGANREEMAVILGNVAFVFSKIGEFGQATDIARRALELAEAQFGPEHARTIVARNNLATALGRNGDPGGAIQLLETNYRAATALGPQGGQLAAIAATSLAAIFADQGRRDAARSWHGRGDVEMARVFEANHPDRIRQQASFGRFLLAGSDEKPLARSLLASAARQVLARITRAKDFDTRAQEELNGYNGIFRDQVRAAWTLRNPDAGAAGRLNGS